MKKFLVNLLFISIHFGLFAANGKPIDDLSRQLQILKDQLVSLQEGLSILPMPPAPPPPVIEKPSITEDDYYKYLEENVFFYLNENILINETDYFSTDALEMYVLYFPYFKNQIEKNKYRENELPQKLVELEQQINAELARRSQEAVQPLSPEAPKFEKFNTLKLKDKLGNLILDNGQEINIRVGVLKEGEDKGKFIYWGPEMPPNTQIKDCFNQKGEFSYPQSELVSKKREMFVLYDPEVGKEVADIQKKAQAYNQQLNLSFLSKASEQLQSNLKGQLTTEISKTLDKFDREAIVKALPTRAFTQFVNNLKTLIQSDDFNQFINEKYLNDLRKLVNSLQTEIASLIEKVEEKIKAIDNAFEALTPAGQTGFTGRRLKEKEATLENVRDALMLKEWQESLNILKELKLQDPSERINTNAQELYNQVMKKSGPVGPVETVKTPEELLKERHVKMAKGQVQTFINAIQKNLAQYESEQQEQIKEGIKRIEDFLSQNNIEGAENAQRDLEVTIAQFGDADWDGDF